MPLIDHLIELRSRLLRSVAVILVAFLVLYPFDNRIYSWISEPLRVYLPKGSSMIATQVASPFFAPLKLTMVIAVFLSIPYLLYQVWSFIAPGLYKHEKRIAMPLLVSSIFLFYLGVVFAYFVVFPIVFGFFTSVAPQGVAVMTDITAYLDFVLKMFFAFGVAFEIPVATILLIIIGVTNVAALSQKRPYIIVGCFVVGMLLTPPDIFSQSLLAVPMWMLFETGVLFGRLVERQMKRHKADTADESA
ncbi:twin-arginine translocase subunit TatC [Mangrovitalea sediminis]|uniref:twin-arginine translocase subunit TatC n=1 Tax=Mangrovitalea sediminis TaxID=1982043 RepID=UPI000BE4DEFA|nr:twin-arginine translocase subunit TatC [Mangrovitalea sediminis]